MPPGCCVHAGLPAWLEATAALAELRDLARSMAEPASAPAAGQAPAVMTFVSNGYEPLLNNWLAWLKHSGADVSRVVVVTPRGHDSVVRGRLLYRGVHVAAMDDLEPDQWAPGTSHELGASKDPNRHARARCEAPTHTTEPVSASSLWGRDALVGGAGRVLHELAEKPCVPAVVCSA